MNARLNAVVVLSLLAVTLSCTDQPKTVDPRFRPTIGEPYTMQVAITQMTRVNEKPSTINHRFTFGFKPMESDAQGIAHIRITIEAIQVKSESVTYDSNGPKDVVDYTGEQYARLIDREFTISISPDGEIADTGLDELLLALGEDWIARDDQAIRDRLGDEAQKVIETANAQYGSRDKRVLATKRQLEEHGEASRRRMECILSALVCPLPERPVRPGDNWTSSFRVGQLVPLDVTTTCKLSSGDQEICTIEIDGRKSLAGKPDVLQSGRSRIEQESSGSYQATVTVGRKTGQLLTRREQVNLTGEFRESNDSRQGPPIAFEIQVTTTVETLR